ncbi:DNA polymerase nu-like [Diaphorina citri]|uniref:DNA polymerase nu-like n=1 Tax=Diaphorina citri TaxID=121845 RepID=A0A3Q0IN53_DIACI|nr:DNA polymerase nu-like [Diaphorina citri]
MLKRMEPYHPLPKIVLEYRRLQKLKSTYVDGILQCVRDEDNTLSTCWELTSAATGRLTSSSPNLQGIPSGI